MIEYKFTLKNEHGLHARPASMFIQEASKFQSAMTLVKDGADFNCKSMIGLMKMGASKGDELLLKIDGADESEALNALKALIDDGFGE